jgi:hypothetical protein
VVGGICVVDIERLTRWLETSRRILVAATAIPPGYRDCRFDPYIRSVCGPMALFSHLFGESATLWKARYFRHYSTAKLDNTLQRVCQLKWASTWSVPRATLRTLRPFSAICVLRFYQARSVLQLLQPDSAAVIANCGHNVESHGQRATAIFQVNQRTGTGLH